VISADLVTDWHKRRRQPGQVERSVCELLRRRAARVPSGQAIVELGAYLGRSTGWLLLGAQEGHQPHVTTVDPWEQYGGDYYTPERGYLPARGGFERHMTRLGTTPAAHTVMQTDAVGAAMRWTGPQVGLLWHDAEHSAEAVARDLYAWKPLVAPGGVIILHDAGNPDMGVEAGAQKVLDNAAWDWPGRRLIRWRRRPDRRGVLIVTKRRPAR
jgi:hypothetical protein